MRHRRRQIRLLGETLDDAAGRGLRQNRQTARIALSGAQRSRDLATNGGVPTSSGFPRPMLHSGDFDFSFSGLKTAVLTKVREIGEPDEQQRADIAQGFQVPIVRFWSKSMRAVRGKRARNSSSRGRRRNRELRRQLDARAAPKRRFWCSTRNWNSATDNGAMIALAGALRFQAGKSIKPPAPLLSTTLAAGQNDSLNA